MERFTIDTMSIVEDATPEEPYIKLTSGTVIQQLGNLYINMYFITKYYNKDITVLLMRDTEQLEILNYLFTDINILQETDIERWRDVTDYIVICNSIDDIKDCKPLAVSCVFDDTINLDGNIYVVPYSELNSYTNRIFIDEWNYKEYDMVKYKLMCNYVNVKLRQHITYSNKFTDNNFDESEVIYIATYYLYKVRNYVNVKFTKLEKHLKELQQYILDNLEYEVIDYLPKRETFTYKGKQYDTENFILNSKVMEFIDIEGIKEADRKRLASVSDNAVFKHIVITYPISRSKKYNQNDFIKKTSNKQSMLSYIDTVRTKLLYEDKGNNFTILDNCSVKKFTDTTRATVNFYDRIFNLIRLNNINYSKENEDIIHKFLDCCVDILV